MSSRGGREKRRPTLRLGSTAPPGMDYHARAETASTTGTRDHALSLLDGSQQNTFTTTCVCAPPSFLREFLGESQPWMYDR